MKNITMNAEQQAAYFSREAEDARFEKIDKRIAELEAENAKAENK